MLAGRSGTVVNAYASSLTVLVSPHLVDEPAGAIAQDRPIPVRRCQEASRRLRTTCYAMWQRSKKGI